MKKRDLVLDFTSLLDVIMIILFVVISSMGQASFHAKEEAEKQIEDTKQSLKDLQNKYNEIDANNEELQKQIEELVKENNLYKTEDIDKGLLYEKLMEESKKITLICTPYINPNKSNGNEVEVTLYSSEMGGEQEALDIVVFTHNFNLTREERIVKNAEMQADMYRALENIIKGNDVGFVFVTIEYTYGDKNFSQTDLNNIIKAVDDLERNYSITCYIDKVKQ
ncbi:MAG: hypothetical protein HFG39_10905 [Lachnospiraceae bacterium]|nr:hypothetical protein [Lachnospiraceae bacterium]